LRIAIMSRWNATCGISLHAELVGRELMRLGHDIVVFAPYVESANKWWHHRLIRDDEDFVVRCYCEADPSWTFEGSIDEDRVLSEPFDALIVESYASIPYRHVERLVEKLRGKVPVVAVIHEGSRAQMKYSSLAIFDRVVVFDERFLDEVVGRVGNACVIPYPCRPPVAARSRRFGEGGLRFFSFGRQPVDEYEDFVYALRVLRERHGLDFRYVVVRSDGLLPYSEPWLTQVRRRPTIDELYNYLLGVDIHLLPKKDTRGVVVSSTFCQTVGSLTPTVSIASRYYEALPEIGGVKPIALYRDRDDLVRVILRIVEDGEFRRRLVEAMRVYAEQNSTLRVAAMFLALLEELMESI